MRQKNTSRSNKEYDVESLMEISKCTTKTYDPSGPMAFLQSLGAPITAEIKEYENECKQATLHDLVLWSKKEENNSTQDYLNLKVNTLKQMEGNNIKSPLMESFIASYYLNEMSKTQQMPDPEASKAWLDASLTTSNNPRDNNNYNNNNNNAYPGSRDSSKAAAMLLNTNKGYGGQVSRGQTMVAAAAGGGFMPNPTTRPRQLLPQQQEPAYRSASNINAYVGLPSLPPPAAPKTCDQCAKPYRNEGRIGQIAGGPLVTFCLNCASTNTKFQPMRQRNDARSRGGGGGEHLLANVQPGNGNNIRIIPQGFETLNNRPAGNNYNSRTSNGLRPNSGTKKAPLALVNSVGGRPGGGEQQQQWRLRQRKKTQGTDDNPINLISDDEDDTNKNSTKQQQQQQGEESPPRSSPPIAISVRQRTLRQTTLNTRKAVSMKKTEEKLKGLKCLYPISGGPGSVELNALDVARLDEYEFLNDSVIDFYIKWLQSDIPRDIASRCYFFNTFFYKKLTEKNYHVLPQELEQYKINKNLRNLDLYALMNHDKVKKWTKDTDIFSKDYIFIPVHMDLHWSLIIVCNPGLWDPTPPSSSDDGDDGTDPRAKPKAGPVLIHLDSLSGGHSSKPACDIVRRYLRFEWVSKMRALKEQKHQQEANGGGASNSSRSSSRSSRLTAYQRWEKTHPGGEERVFDEKTFPYKRAAAPRQDNYCDCGLFVLTNMEFFIRRLPETINVAAITALKEKYEKDNLDLNQITTVVDVSRNNNNKSNSSSDGDSGRDTEHGRFPGMLTSYWYLPQNASNLRWRVRHDILQLLGEQNHLYDRERNTFVPMDAVPVKMRELRKNLEEEFDLVTALTINHPYYSPKNEKYVEEQIKNKQARNMAVWERMQVQENRRKQEREEKTKRREAVAKAAEARANWKPDEDFAIDIDDNTDDDDDDDDDDDEEEEEEEELEKSQQKAMKVVKSTAEEQRRKKKRRVTVTNVIQDSNDDDDEDAAFAAQFQMTKGGIAEQAAAGDDGARNGRAKNNERKNSIDHWKDDDIGDVNEEAAFVIDDEDADNDEDYYEVLEGDADAEADADDSGSDSDDYMEAKEEREDGAEEEDKEEEQQKKEKKKVHLRFDKDKSAAAKRERKRQRNRNRNEGPSPVEKIKKGREKQEEEKEVIMIDSDDDGNDDDNNNNNNDNNNNKGGGRPAVDKKTRTVSDLQNDIAANVPLYPGMKVFQRKAKQVVNRGGGGGEGSRVRKEIPGFPDTIKNALAMPMGDDRRMQKNSGGGSGFPNSSIEEEIF